MVFFVASSSEATAQDTLRVEDLRYIADRSPNVFDTNFGLQTYYETELPTVYFELDLVIGPTVNIPRPSGLEEATIAGGQFSIGSVLWQWDDKAGIRIGLDGFSTNLTPSGQPFDDGWGYRTGLVYAGAFDSEAGWSASAGVYFTMVPVTEQVNGQTIFSSNEDGTTKVDTVSAYLHGTVPWIDLTFGVLVDGEGVRQAKGTVDVFETDLWESVGPHFAIVPRFENYQYGVHARRLRLWEFPATVSTEITGRWEENEGFAFDHALLKGDVTLFEDEPKPDAPATNQIDVSILIEAMTSYHNIPDIDSPWGGGANLGFIFTGFADAVCRLTFGAALNYYENTIMLPIPGAFTLKGVLSVGA